MRNVYSTSLLRRIPLLIVTALLISTGSNLHAQSAEQARLSLAQDIQDAQRGLERAQARITEQRRDMSSELQALERQVQQLRDEAATAQRAADERTLSLNSLTGRLKEWQEQSRYQHYLLDNFHSLVDVEASADAFPEQDMDAKVSWLEQHVATLGYQLNPQWRTGDMIMPSGIITAASVLTLGPVGWYLDEAGGTGGILNNQGDADMPQAMLALGDSALTELVRLRETGAGLPPFDPTLSRALQMAEQHETLMQHVSKGGLWAIPILVFGLVALLVALVKAAQLWRLPAINSSGGKLLLHSVETTSPEEHGALLSQHASRLRGMQQTLLEIATRTAPGQMRDDRLFAQLNSDRQKLERWLGSIAVIAAVSPLLGLLGTVSGMIATFQLMTIFGAGDPEAVSGGISEALVTTELGLIVAIPALLLHALLSRRVKSYLSSLENTAVDYSQLPKATLHA